MADLEQGAMHLADLAFIETDGSNADKVEAAIWAYLWAVESKVDLGAFDAYPSLIDLRNALNGRKVH
jgi:hypothetical protein